MPHILLEHSANVVNAPSPTTVFADLHLALAALESFPIADLKSRAVTHDAYYLGQGDPGRSFIHLQLRLLSGRDQSVRQRLAKECMRVLEAHYTYDVVGTECQLSVEVQEMERSTYVKHKHDPR